MGSVPAVVVVDGPAEPKPRGRPPYQPTEQDRKTVEAMAACGIPHEQIAPVVGMAPKALRKHFRDELDLAATKANAKVAATLFAAATSGRDLAATIFWCKVRLGWREATEQRITGADGHAVKIEIEYVNKPVDAYPPETPDPSR